MEINKPIKTEEEYESALKKMVMQNENLIASAKKNGDYFSC